MKNAPPTLLNGLVLQVDGQIAGTDFFLPHHNRYFFTNSGFNQSLNTFITFSTFGRLMFCT